MAPSIISEAKKNCNNQNGHPSNIKLNTLPDATPNIKNTCAYKAGNLKRSFPLPIIQSITMDKYKPINVLMKCLMVREVTPTSTPNSILNDPSGMKP